MAKFFSKIKLAIRLARYENDRLSYIKKQTLNSREGRVSLVTESEVLLTDIELCRQALSCKDGSLMKSRDFIGEIVTKEGWVEWMKTRKTAQPMLNPNALLQNSITSVFEMRRRAFDIIPLLTAFDPFEIACRYCSNNIGKYTLGNNYNIVAEDFKILLDLLGPVTSSPFKADAPWQREYEERAMEHYKILRKKIEIIVENAILNKGEETLLNHLIKQKDLSLNQISGFIIGANLAGHAVPAAAVAWACYLIEKNIDKKRTLIEDLKKSASTVESKGTSQYLIGVVKEALRLFPPTWLLKRDLVDEGEGDAIAKGAKYVMISPYGIGRDENIYNQAEEFKPERHITGECPSNLVFGSGEHFCPGQHFAFYEINIFLSILYSKFEVETACNINSVAKDCSRTLIPVGLSLIAKK